MSSAEQEDALDDVLNLEEQYYQEGHALGVADGTRAGQIEGRTFGLEKGFEKFLEMGRLHGRALVWEARLPGNTAVTSAQQLPPDQPFPSLKLSDNERLRKHVNRLAALTEPAGLSTDNSEDAVSEFDDRLIDAQAKARLIAKLVGEDANQAGLGSSASGGVSSPTASSSRNRDERIVKQSGEMEDFAGLPNTKA